MSVRSSRGRPLKGDANTKLGRLRREGGYTQTDMAYRTGLSPSAYGRLERNENPHDVNLRELANCALVLGVDVTELFESEWLVRYEFGQPRAPRK